MFEYAGLMLDLGKLLRRKVDLVQKEGLKKYARDAVLAEARVIYAR
jgi:predicted nucleotidyltransferase